MSVPAPPPRLHLIGQATCHHGDGSTLVLEAKDALLLAYLVLEGPTSRKVLAALLWPDVDDERARANLRQRLFRLRKALGFELLAGAAVVNVPAEVVVDIAGADAGDGELLAAVSEHDAAGLAPWLAQARQRRRALRIAAMTAEAARLESAGAIIPALAAAQQLLASDPASEHAHRQVMRLHYLSGDRAAALLAFDRCEHMLKHEVGARPSAETLALLQTIEQARAATWFSGQPLPAAVLRPPRTIGREAEGATVLRAWQAGEVFVLTGATGMGKSRLLATLFDARADVLVLRARPGDDAVPLATLMRLVAALAERGLASPGLAAHAQLLKLASGSGLDPHGAIHSAAPLGAELLAAAHRHGHQHEHQHGLTGIVLDDLQFADEASVDTWCDWLDRPALAGLRFGFASRVQGQGAHARVERLRQRGDVIAIAVPALTAGQTLALVASLALAGTDVAAVAQALNARIGGNPLHLLETIRHALEQHGQLRVDRLNAPAQVLDLLEQRLAAVSADSLALVRIAVVAGSDFSPELAQAVSGRDVLELADAWSALERQGILDPRGFAHDLMLEAALRLLPEVIKRVIHGRVAEYLLPRTAAPARLAHHWLAAGDPLAALAPLTAAARLAWRAGRGLETRDAFFKAADIELGRGEPDAAFALLFECAEAMARLCPVGDFDAVVTRLAPLVRTASHRARLTVLQAGSLYLHGDHAASTQMMADAQLLAIACGDQLVEAECLYDKAWRSSVAGRLREAVEQLSACAMLQRSIGQERLALVTDASKLGILRKLGQARLVLAQQQRSLLWLIENGAPVDVATSLVDQVLNQLDLGEVGAADAATERAWQAVRETDMRGEELALNARTMLRIHRRRGRWGLALNVAAEATQRLTAQSENAQALAAEMAELYLDLGRPELALPHIDSACAEADHLEHARWHGMALRWRYQSAAGAPAEPLATLAAALQSERFPIACELMLVAGQACAEQLSAAALPPLIAGCEQRGLHAYLLPLRALQAWLLAREGDLEAALAGAAELPAALRAADLGVALPASALWLAKALQGAGQRSPAGAVAQQAALWVRQRLAESVPAEFHDSLCQRNPVHREVLALAQSLAR